jgi:hypothetical protein
MAVYNYRKSGVSWWETTASSKLLKAIKERKEREGYFSSLVDANITFTSFEDLNELVHASFSDEQFLDNWAKITELKERVSYHDLFIVDDYKEAKRISKKIIDFVTHAEDKIETTKVTKKVSTAKKKKTSEKSAPTQHKTVEKEVATRVETKPEPVQSVPTPVEDAPQKPEPVAETPKPVEDGVREDQPTPEPAVAEKEPEPTPKKRVSNGFEMITEKEFLEELKDVQAKEPGYVNLKTFVSETLADKGFMSGPTFSLTNNMDQKGLVKIYEVIDDKGFTIKAVKAL